MRDRIDDAGFRDLRIDAAHLAIESLALTGQPPTMAEAAVWQDFWLARILAPQAAALQWTATVTDQHGRTRYQVSSSNGGTMATAITMDDTLTVAAQTEDDHGDPTPDTLSWAGSDGGAVLALAVSADTLSVVATPVAEGSSTITVTDTSAAGITGTLDVTVGPGTTSQIVLTPAVNTGANAVPPAG